MFFETTDFFPGFRQIAHWGLVPCKSFSVREGTSRVFDFFWISCGDKFLRSFTSPPCVVWVVQNSSVKHLFWRPNHCYTEAMLWTSSSISALFKRFVTRSCVNVKIDPALIRNAFKLMIMDTWWVLILIDDDKGAMLMYGRWWWWMMKVLFAQISEAGFVICS